MRRCTKDWSADGWRDRNHAERTLTLLPPPVEIERDLPLDLPAADDELGRDVAVLSRVAVS